MRFSIGLGQWSVWLAAWQADALADGRIESQTDEALKQIIKWGLMGEKFIPPVMVKTFKTLTRGKVLSNLSFTVESDSMIV